MGPQSVVLLCQKVYFHLGSPKGTPKCDLHFVENSKIRGTRLDKCYSIDRQNSRQFFRKEFKISYLGPPTILPAHKQQSKTLLSLRMTLFYVLQIVENFYLYKIPYLYQYKKSLFLLTIFGSNEKNTLFYLEK